MIYEELQKIVILNIYSNMLNDNNNDDGKDNNTWTSCCLSVDKDAVLFFSQFGISVGVISFCLYQLLHIPDCEGQNAYTGLLTLILGVWLPSPKMKLA